MSVPRSDAALYAVGALLVLLFSTREAVRIPCSQKYWQKLAVGAQHASLFPLKYVLTMQRQDHNNIITLLFLLLL